MNYFVVRGIQKSSMSTQSLSTRADLTRMLLALRVNQRNFFLLFLFLDHFSLLSLC